MEAPGGGRLGPRQDLKGWVECQLTSVSKVEL